MEARFTKLLEGDWGVRVQGVETAPQPGDMLVVERRDGETTKVIVSKVVWSGAFDGVPVHLCAIQAEDEAPRQRKASAPPTRLAKARPAQPQRTCADCGAVIRHGRYCRDCAES